MITDAARIEDQPVVITDCWRLYELRGEVYIVCVISETGKTRTTTAIKKSNPETREFTTASGRIYKCLGDMAPSSDEFYLAILNCGLITSLDDLDDLRIVKKGLHLDPFTLEACITFHVETPNFSTWKQMGMTLCPRDVGLH